MTIIMLITTMMVMMALATIVMRIDDGDDVGRAVVVGLADHSSGIGCESAPIRREVQRAACFALLQTFAGGCPFKKGFSRIINRVNILQHMKEQST